LGDLATIDKRHPDYDKACDGWRIVRDCVEGTRAVKRAAERYLPALYKQDPIDYQKRQKRALFFGATKKTLNAFEGFIFRVNPEFKTPATMADFMRDCTMTGVSFYDYCKQVARDVTSVGRTGTLVDWDDPANENRPFLVRYDTEDIIDWEYRRVKGHTVLSRLTLYECVSETPQEVGLAPDQYERKETERWRIYELVEDAEEEFVVCRLWEKITTGSGETATMRFSLVKTYFPNRRAVPLPRIPFVFHNVSGDQAKPDDIPMEGFAELNISHYQTSADIEGALYVCGVPTPFACGFGSSDEQAEFILGSSKAWVSQNPDAKAGFIELSGDSIAPLERSMDKKERQMAALGARMLESQTAARTAEAFETVQVRQSGEVASLSNITIMCSQTLSKTLRQVAWWMGAEETPDDFVDKVFVELNTDFVSSKLDAPLTQAVLNLYLSDPPTISYETLFDILQRGQLISSERTLKEELAAIEKLKAEREAKAQADAQRQADLMKQQTPPTPPE